MDTETRKKFKQLEEAVAEVKVELTDVRLRQENFVTRTEFEDFRAYVEENMFTRKDFMKFMETYEPMMKEVLASRKERIVFWHRFSIMDDSIADHEKRLRLIENTNK